MDGVEFRAGVEIHGRALRYAEVQARAVGASGSASGSPRLVRLGACDFDFDVAEALLGLSGPANLDTVATAIREIFADSSARVLTVAVHPWDSTSFFSPLPAGMPPAARFEQLRQEAAMLSDATVARPVRVKATPMRIETLDDGRKAHWHHVLRLADSAHARLDHIAKRSDEAEHAWPHEFVDATAAAAAVLGQRFETTRDEDREDDPFALAIGVYGARCEIALCRGATWYFGYHAESGALEDDAYFVAALLDRLGVALTSVESLYLYGADVEADAVDGVEDLFDLEAQPLNPLDVFHPARSGADPLTLAAYTPVIGALLR